MTDALKLRDMWVGIPSAWDARAAERDVASARRIMSVLKAGGPDSLARAMSGCMPDKCRSLYREALKEMSRVLDHGEPECHFHINHVTSGKVKYGVFLNDSKSYYFVGEYFNYNTARMAKARYVDSYIDEYEDVDGKRSWLVWALDEVGTRALREKRVGGTPVGYCDTNSEAEAEAAKYQDAYIESFVDEQWWCVVNDQTGHLEYQALFPSPDMALSYLYKAAQPPAWMAFVEARAMV